MADQPNLFDATTVATTVPPVTTTTNDPVVDKLNSILGPDGKPKYANAAIALDALAASQAHIARLEQEAKDRAEEVARLKQANETSKSVEELVETLRNKNTSDTTQVTPPSGLDEKATLELVRRTLEDRERQSTAQANLTKVNDTLTTKYGDKATETVAAKAKELGMTTQELGILAGRSPALVLELFGEKSQPVTSTSPTTSSIHIDTTRQPNDEIKLPGSLLSGKFATDANRTEAMRKIREKVYKQYEVTP